MSGSCFDEHPDRIRILKLLFFVDTQSWISDEKELEGESIQALLSRLLNQAPSLDDFQHRLMQSAGKLNKSKAYLEVAQTIIQELQDRPENITPTVQPIDFFELRHALMQAVNPFKAKLILFALWHQHNSPQLPLKTSSVIQYSLDELLKKAIHGYPSLARLEEGLRSIKSVLLDLEPREITQASESLKIALSPYLPEMLSIPESDFDPMQQDPASMKTIFMPPNSSQQLSR